MTVVQFTRFRTAPERERAMLEARQAALCACQGTQPELRGAYLIRLTDGEWLDIAIWAGPPGHAAFDDPRQAASRVVFYDQIDELLGEECGILVNAPDMTGMRAAGTAASRPPHGLHGVCKPAARPWRDLWEELEEDVMSNQIQPWRVLRRGVRGFQRALGTTGAGPIARSRGRGAAGYSLSTVNKRQLPV